MNTGEHLWMIPHGEMIAKQQEAFRNNPLLKGVKVDTNWGRRGHAAMMATSTLLFATRHDRRRPAAPVRDRQEDAASASGRWRRRASGSTA